MKCPLEPLNVKRLAQPLICANICLSIKTGEAIDKSQISHPVYSYIEDPIWPRPSCGGNRCHRSPPHGANP